MYFSTVGGQMRLYTVLPCERTNYPLSDVLRYRWRTYPFVRCFAMRAYKLSSVCSTVDQGENNLFADAGTTLTSTNAPKGSGYACLLRQQMASWRASWSSVPDTTSPTAPFGIVQLADGTDEG